MNENSSRKNTLPLVLLALAIVVNIGSKFVFGFYSPYALIWSVGSATLLIIYLLSASKGYGDILFPIGIGLLLVNALFEIVDILVALFDPKWTSAFTQLYYRESFRWYVSFIHWPFYFGFDFVKLLLFVFGIIAYIGIIILICDWHKGRINNRKIGSILLLGFCVRPVYEAIAVLSRTSETYVVLGGLFNDYLPFALIAIAVFTMHRAGLIVKHERKVNRQIEEDEKDIATEIRILKQNYETGEITEQEYQDKRTELLNKL